MFSNAGQTSSSAPSLFSSNPTTSAQPSGSPFGTTGTTGTTGTSAPSQPSLFSNLGTTPQPQSSNPFSNNRFAGTGAAGSQAQNTGGLFGRIGNTNTSQAPQQQSTATSSLFSGLGASTAQPQQSNTAGSLFSSLGASTTQPQQQSTTTSSLFGGLGASTSQAQQQSNASSSLFGGLGVSSTQPQSNTAAPQPGQTQQQGGPLSQSTNAPARSAHFDHLLERGRKRNNQENGVNQFGDLPSLQLGLGDIARKVRNLGGSGASAPQAQDSRAHYLLAASGVSTGSTLRDLNQFSAQAGLSTTGPSSNALDTDIDGYIANLQSQSTLALIQEGLEQSKRDFDTFLEENVQMEWDAQRRRIYEHFGLAKQSENLATSTSATQSQAARGAFGRSTRRGRGLGAATASAAGMSFGASGMRSVIGSPATGFQGRMSTPQDSPDKAGAGLQSAPQNRFDRDKQEKYAAKVKELNTARLQEAIYPVLQQFAEVEFQSGIDNTQQLVDSYNALISITKEDPKVSRPSDPGAIKERHYSTYYLDPTPTSNKSIALRKRIIDGSRQFLEKHYFNQLEVAISKNPREANLGGIPSTINKVRAYIRLKSARKELGAENELFRRIGQDGDYPWVLVFHLLRSGLTKEAAQYVAENEPFFKAHDRAFISAIAYYTKDPDRRLNQDLQTRINNTFSSRARIAAADDDPYCTACYKVIGRCELSRRNIEGIGQSMEDWVWLQFNLVRETVRSEDSPAESFGLEELRATISDIGQRHFSPGSENAGGYGTFFFLQILAGMFEQAVSFLYQHNYTAAVHFAIALGYYGLLRVADWTSSGSDILTFTPSQKPQLNFGQMIGYYTRDFRAAKAEAATDYLTLICFNADLPGEAGKRQADLCHEALRELVLETREFAELLGDIRSDGTSIKGTIEQRLSLIKIEDKKNFLKTITIQAAKVADDSGRTTDAVLLYHLSEEFDNVVSILNRALSEAISVDLGQESLRLEPLKPRAAALTPGQPQQPQQPGSSLSLTSIDDPADLARSMIAMYDTNSSYYGKISARNRDTIKLLLDMSNAKKTVEAGRWPEALDIITSTSLLPLRALGSLPAIRSCATNFSTYPPEVARNIGNLLMWTITCCGRHREALLSSQYEDWTRKKIADDLLQAAKDLMVFAGLIRYKLPPRVFEVLARAGQDVGVY